VNATSAVEQLEQARGQLTAAQEKLANLNSIEAKAIQSGVEFEIWHKDHRSTSIEVERLTKLLARLGEGVERERREHLLARADEQLKANQALAERMREEGPEIVQKLRGLLRDLAHADIATTNINAMLPADVARVKTADVIARAREMRPRQDVSERQVELWVGIENGTPIADQTSVTDLGNGIGTIPSASSAKVLKCRRRRYRQIEYRPEEPVERVEPLRKVLRLPHFDKPGLAWSGDHISSPRAALQFLDREAPEPRKETLTELVPDGPWVSPVIPRSSTKPKTASAASGDC
jgi:hypothetical protein